MQRSELCNIARLLLAASLFLLGCGGGSNGGAGGGASPRVPVEGEARLGPICPVEMEGLECDDAAYVGELVVLDSAGERAASITTDTEGRFTLSLLPGQYLIQNEPGETGLPVCGPMDLLVGDEPLTVTVLCDTGIR